MSNLPEVLLLKVKETVLQYFDEEPVRIVFFGSRARGENIPSSDIDVGILPQNSYNRAKLALVREALENMNIPYVVDVVDLSEVSEGFREKVLEEGVIWKD